MRIGIIGAGAVGSIVGGLLTRAERDVTLVDQWPEHDESEYHGGVAGTGALSRKHHTRQGGANA